MKQWGERCKRIPGNPVCHRGCRRTIFDSYVDESTQEIDESAAKMLALVLVLDLHRAQGSQ